MPRSPICVCCTLLIATLLLPTHSSWAWGRRGHQIVGETAAQILGVRDEGQILRDRSFDIAYYSNVPDVVWKKPATYELERHNHYMDLEPLFKIFGTQDELRKKIDTDRASFDSQFTEIKQNDGRAYWRIRELVAGLEATTEALKKVSAETERSSRHQLQAKWLQLAGLISHYVGDLGQPLHTSINHDGQATHQTGVHSHFEDSCVNELYPQLTVEVLADAKREWRKFHKNNDKKSLTDLLTTLVFNSHKQIDPLLRIDRKIKRQELKKSAQAFHRLIRGQLVASSLVLTELYSRNLGWNYDRDKFYDFVPSPEYLQPGAIITSP